MNVARSRSLQEIMALQKAPQLSRDRNFQNQNRLLSSPLQERLPGGDLPGLKDTEKSQGVKVTPCSV